MITRFLHIGQTLYFHWQSCLFERQTQAGLHEFTWVSSAPINLFCLDLPFYKTSPGVPVHFLMHSGACNEKEPGHSPFEHLLAQSKTYLLCVHVGLGYFLRINGAAKWRKVYTLLKKLVLIWIPPDSWQNAVIPLWTMGSFSECEQIHSNNL